MPPRRGTGQGVVPRALRDGLCDGVAITVAATIATAPLVAFHFGSLPLAGLAANVLALPAVAPAMWLGMVKAALGVAGPLLPGSDGLAELLGLPTHVAIAYLDGLAERCATLPGGRLRLPLHSPVSVVAAYGAMAALLFAPRLARTTRSRRTRPGALELAAAWRRAPRALRVGVAALARGSARARRGRAARHAGAARRPHGAVPRHRPGRCHADPGRRRRRRAVRRRPARGARHRLLRRAGVRRLDAGGGHPPVARPPGWPGRGARPLSRSACCSTAGDGTTDRGLPAPARRGGRARGPPGRAREPANTCGSVGSRSRCSRRAPRPRAPRAGGPESARRRGDRQLGRLRPAAVSATPRATALLPLPLPDVEAMKVPHHGSADPGLPEVLERLRPGDRRDRGRRRQHLRAPDPDDARGPPRRRCRTCTAPTATGP